MAISVFFFLEMCLVSLVRELNAWALGQGEFTTALQNASIPLKSVTITFTNLFDEKLVRVLHTKSGISFKERANILAKERWSPPINVVVPDAEANTMLRDYHEFLNFAQFVLGYEQNRTNYSIQKPK